MSEPSAGQWRDLRSLAEKATPGPWVAKLDAGEIDFHGFRMQATVETPLWAKYGFRNDDAHYIAAVDPQTILALLDELERLQAAAEVGSTIQGVLDGWHRSR